jgi:hypothetical protein
VTSPDVQPATVYRNRRIRITDLVGSEQPFVIANLRFEDCIITGPAVIALSDGVTIARSGFDVVGAEGLFWPIGEDRTDLQGAIIAVNVVFDTCRFTGIGLAVDEGSIGELIEGFGSEPPEA